MLRIVFTVAPILFGLDKFAGSGLLVAGWLAGIILNLLIIGGYGDIALRDFGLLLAALTLFRLSSIDAPARGHVPLTA